MSFAGLFRSLVLLLFMLASALPAVAADYTVSPLARNYDLERRDIVNGLITITNTTDRQLRLYAGVNEVATDGDGIIESFTPPSMTDRKIDPTSWIQITRSRLEVPAGDKLEVPFTIKLHPQTEPGKYSVFIGFATGSNQPQAQAKIARGEGLGTLLNIGVAQKNNQFVQLQSYRVDRFVTGEGGVIDFELHNPGRAPVTPEGEVIVYDTRGKEIMTLPINAAELRIEEADTQSFSLPIPADLSLGKYKAYLAVEYGDTMRAAVTDSDTFYVAPLMQLVMIFLGLLVVVTIVTLLVYRRYDSSYDDGTELVPMYIRATQSNQAEHDIDLKKRYDPPT